MNKLSKMAKSAALCFALFATSQANAGSLYLTGFDWAIDPTGTVGDTSGLIDLDAFNFGSYTLVTFGDTDNSGTLTEGDRFTDYSYLYPTSNGDTSGALSDIYALNADMGGSFGQVFPVGPQNLSTATFDSGSTQNWYDGATDTNILTLDLLNASTNVFTNPAGDQITQVGQIDFQFQVSQAAAGYFYVMIDGAWVDVSDILDGTVDVYDGNIYAKTSTLTQVPDSVDNPDAIPMLDDIASDALAALAPYTGFTSSAQYLNGDLGNSGYLTANNGNVDLAAVPEPGMLSLMGLAFLGLAGFQNRRRNQKSN